MKPRFSLVVALLAAWYWMPNLAEAGPRYELRSRAYKVKFCGSFLDNWDIWLWDNERHRVIWKRRRLEVFEAKRGVHWSKDHRALAVECVGDKWQVLVWREGYRLRDFAVPDSNDYTMGCLWSPDNRRLLVRAGGSGANMIDIGELY